MRANAGQVDTGLLEIATPGTMNHRTIMPMALIITLITVFFIILVLWPK
jgi:hypothetical protein